MRHIAETVFVSLLAFGCSGESVSNDAGSDAHDEVPPVGGGGDSGADASAETGPTTTYNDVSSSTFWSSFDTTFVNANVAGFSGATFDGSYVYFAPALGGVALRHDISKTVASGWEAFDMTGLNAAAHGYSGLAFDGRYVYFAPDANGQPFGLVTRFDTQAAFTLPTAWSTFDLTTVNALAKGFVGVVFDGRYLYLVPNDSGGTTSTLFARFDTQATFGAAASWSTVDVHPFNAVVSSFFGGVFDGRYVYFTGGGENPIVARYDTQGTFGATVAWSFFNLATVDSKATAYATPSFDGRYVYFAPRDATATVARYDVQSDFATAASWTTFHTTTVDPNAGLTFGGAFDGRYVYIDNLLHPNVDGGATESGLVFRLDDTASFGSSTSWSKFDMATLTPPLIATTSAVFDGVHMYFGGLFSNVIARFDAKTPSSVPPLPQFHGSFF